MMTPRSGTGGADVTPLRGKRGLVILERRGDLTVAVKIRNPRSKAPDTLAHEAEMLRAVNAAGIGPTLIEAAPAHLAMEYIKGVPLGKFLAMAEGVEILPVLRAILDQCRRLDELGFTKQELNHPYKDILVRQGAGVEGEPVMLDFERARKSLAPKNVTQFCQYLTSHAVTQMLAEAGLSVDTAGMRKHARAYKATQTRLAFEAIVACVQAAPQTS
jgi:predicted Ser/Thr protein kinase